MKCWKIPPVTGLRWTVWLVPSLLVLCCGVVSCARHEPVRQIPEVDEDNAQVQVYPLQDPAVQRFMVRAEQLREQGDLDHAIKAVEEALVLAPRDPQVLQEMAELQLLDGDYREANRLARESFALGPRVGPLCERNWNTVALAAPRIGDDEGAREAVNEFPKCALPPVPHVNDDVP